MKFRKKSYWRCMATKVQAKRSLTGLSHPLRLSLLATNCDSVLRGSLLGLALLSRELLGRGLVPSEEPPSDLADG
jgi:hypothetical protein